MASFSQQRQFFPAMPSSSPSQPFSSTTTTTTPIPAFPPQFSLFLTGASFVALSSLITRRAINRRLISTIPRFYQPSNHSPTKVPGEFEAVAALGLATMHVASIFVMVSGGLAWAYDVGSVEELRRRIMMRKVIVGSESMGSGGEKSEDDVEMEGLVARALGRKEDQVRGRRQGDEESKKQKSEADEIREGN